MRLLNEYRPNRVGCSPRGGLVELREESVLRANERALVLPEPWRSADVAVVLPTYQEAANLPVIVAALFDLPLAALRVLVMDHNSLDGTGRIAEELADMYGRHRLAVVHRAGKEGLGRGYVDGMSRALAAGADLVVQMDSDSGRNELPVHAARFEDHRTADSLF